MKIKLAGKLEDASSRDFSNLIPDGAYLVKAVDVELIEKEDRSKSDSIRVEMELLEGPKDAAPYIGDHISDFIANHENTQFKVKNLLVAATGNKDIRGSEFDSDLVVGKMLVAVFRRQEYEGNTSSRVQSYKHAAKWPKAHVKIDEPAPAAGGEQLSL